MNISRMPFGRATVFSCVDTLVVVATADRFELELYSAAGRLVRRRVRPVRPTAPA